MTAPAGVVRVALPCTGLGRHRRGFEAVTRDVHAALRGWPGLDLRVFGGGGDLEPGEQNVWNLPRDSAWAAMVARLTGRGAYFVEQGTFFAGFVPHLLSWQPHVVYFADLNFGNACWHFRRAAGLPFRLVYYNGGPTTQPYTRCDFVQQMTPAHFDAAVARGEDASRMCVLPHALALPATLPPRDAARITARRRAFGVPDGTPMLLSVGMLGAELKRMPDLVRAVAALGDARPHLVMLGQETPETPALRALAAELLGDRWHMATLPREQMPDAYAAADAFALLSLDEGFGLVYLEALSAGLPCVVHDNANTRYILGAHGQRVDTTDRAATAAAVAAALAERTTDPQRAERFAWVRERFGWEALAPRYAELFQACAAGRRPAWEAR